MTKFIMTSVLAAALTSTSAYAATIYGNSAGFANNQIHTIDAATGVESARFTGQASGNGRGVVVIGNVIYYTVVGDSKIYTMDRTTGANTGFIQTSNASMSTLAWDGSQFWTADYSGSNSAFRINLAGVNTKLISLTNAVHYMDGLEYFNGKLISNRGDGDSIYDIYDLDGNVLSSSFINTGGFSTGIAYDGKNFEVSRLSSIDTYDGLTGAFISTLPLSSTLGDRSFLIEDLSVDYSTRIDTGAVPEPATWAMMLAGFGIVGGTMRYRRRSTKVSFA